METIKLIWEVIVIGFRGIPWWLWIFVIVLFGARVYVNRTVWGGKYLWVPPFLKRKSKREEKK
jgi:hypothetical protein